MPTINPESHKTRSSYLCKPEVGPGRFWEKVQRSDGCWLWTGSLMTRGYGQVFWNGRPDGAHRVAWMLTRGEIPDGLYVLHRCDNRPCVRPDHLFLGTHEINMKDAVTKGRFHTPRPTRQKVTDEQLGEMLALRSAGMLQKDIAARFGVTKGFVSLLVRGKRRQYSEPKPRKEQVA